MLEQPTCLQSSSQADESMADEKEQDAFLACQHWDQCLAKILRCMDGK
jgi:hypothetical protein